MMSCDHPKRIDRDEPHFIMKMKWFRKVAQILHLFDSILKVAYAEGDTCETSKFIKTHTNIPPTVCCPMTYNDDFALPEGSFIDTDGFKICNKSLMEVEFPTYDNPDFAHLDKDARPQGIANGKFACVWVDGTVNTKQKREDMDYGWISLDTRFTVFGIIDKYMDNGSILMITVNMRKTAYTFDDIICEIMERAAAVKLEVHEYEHLYYHSVINCAESCPQKPLNKTKHMLFIAMQFKRI